MPLPIPTNPLTRPWLLLAIGAIGLSALFAILLVAARTPLLQQLFGGADLFHTVLVLHVNFSVLIWLLAFGALLWSLAMDNYHPVIDPVAFGLVITGAMLLSLAPLLTPPPQPVMSNYIPVLQSPAFLTGLIAFSAGIGLYALRRLLVTGDLAGRLSALALLLSLLVFAITAWRLPAPLDSAAAFESLFWGGGHMLQFVYLLLLFSCWQQLQGEPLPARLLALLVLPLLLLGVVMALSLPPDSAASRDGFTQLMRLGTPLLILPAAMALWRCTPQQWVWRSLLLLLAGLLLGMLIRGDNVSVTAHYHATNAAITLAFMALSYRLAGQLGLARHNPRRVSQQLAAYLFGMVIYITGMAFSGLLDVPRKVALFTDGVQAIAMGLMGLGGLIAICATLLFVALHLQSQRGLRTVPQVSGGGHEGRT